MNKIEFIDEDGKKIELYVVDETTLNENHYILASEEKEENSMAYILKEVERNDSDMIFEIVSDEKEFDSVLSIFEELIDDVDFE